MSRTFIPQCGPEMRNALLRVGHCDQVSTINQIVYFGWWRNHSVTSSVNP